MNSSPSTPTPLDALAHLLRQVEELREASVKENAAVILRLQASAWREGYDLGWLNGRRHNAFPVENPYDFVPSGEGSNPAPGNPEACTPPDSGNDAAAGHKP